VLAGGVSEERFDVVDESDRVIGRELRAEVHRRGLRHRAIHVLVWDEGGRLFLQKRSMRKDSAPGAWDSSASGHVDSGESYEACAPRELREELGWTPMTGPEPLFKLEACADLGNEFVWIYRTRWDGRDFALNADEIDGGAWFTVEEVEANIARAPQTFARSFRYLWTELRRRGLASA
jgi:isopentenyl-diphosphate Delta-isomerase